MNSVSPINYQAAMIKGLENWVCGQDLENAFWTPLLLFLHMTNIFQEN